jgi:AcrR family transcriptional regulator
VTRDEILNAAAVIFRQKGYHAASMQDIAEAVELKKGSLYHHVSSKQNILLALLDQALELLTQELERVTHRDLPAGEKLRLAMRRYLEILTDNLALSSVLLFEHRSLDPQNHRAHIPRRDRFEDLWKEMTAQAMDAGVLPTSDPDLTVKAILGTLNWTITWYRKDGRLNAAELADGFADLFLADQESGGRT